MDEINIEISPEEFGREAVDRVIHTLSDPLTDRYLMMVYMIVIIIVTLYTLSKLANISSIIRDVRSKSPFNDTKALIIVSVIVYILTIYPTYTGEVLKEDIEKIVSVNNIYGVKIEEVISTEKDFEEYKEGIIARKQEYGQLGSSFDTTYYHSGKMKNILSIRKHFLTVDEKSHEILDSYKGRLIEGYYMYDTYRDYGRVIGDVTEEYNKQTKKIEIKLYLSILMLTLFVIIYLESIRYKTNKLAKIRMASIVFGLLVTIISVSSFMYTTNIGNLVNKEIPRVIPEEIQTEIRAGSKEGEEILEKIAKGLPREGKRITPDIYSKEKIRVSIESGADERESGEREEKTINVVNTLLQIPPNVVYYLSVLVTFALTLGGIIHGILTVIEGLTRK